jgi:hypothetical protein
LCSGAAPRRPAGETVAELDLVFLRELLVRFDHLLADIQRLARVDALQKVAELRVGRDAREDRDGHEPANSHLRPLEDVASSMR